MSSAAPTIFHARSSDAVLPITAVVADRNDGRGANVLAPKKGEREAGEGNGDIETGIRRIRKIERK